MRLSKEKFEFAGRFIEQKARPLDKALFHHHYGAVSADAVLAELAYYQNSDGGFGHGLEADFRLAASSPMATSVGLQYAVAVNAQPEHPMIAGAMRYLIATYNFVGSYWPVTFLDVNDEPHAPWWNLEEVCAPLDDDWPNPNAELAGYLHRYASLIPSNLLAKIGKRVVESLEQGGGMMAAMKLYNILCWQRALPYFPSDIQEQIVHQMRNAAQKLPLSPADMMEVNIFWLAPTPDSVIAQERPDEVNELLSLEISRQSADGGWWPTWNWKEYPEAWAIARQEWAGKLTLEAVLALQAHSKCCP